MSIKLTEGGLQLPRWLAYNCRDEWPGYAEIHRHIPVRCINEYRNTLTLYTNGQAVFLTELKDYQIATCEPVIQSRRPNNLIDKVRHMFNKKEN